MRQLSMFSETGKPIIQIALHNGDYKEIEAETVIGQLAIHVHQWGNSEPHGYDLTHLLSCHSILPPGAVFEKYKDALYTAKLVRHYGIDFDAYWRSVKAGQKNRAIMREWNKVIVLDLNYERGNK